MQDKPGIKELTVADNVKAAGFISSHKESMFYHSLPYLNFLSDLLNVKALHKITLDEENNVNGFLPLFVKEGSLGKVFNSSPYYGSHGGVLASSEAAEKKLIAEYNNVVTNENTASSVWVENLVAEKEYKDDVTHNYSDYRIGQFTPIKFSSDHETNLMNSFHYKTRNMVRKGMKSGLNVSVENDNVEFLRDTHRENMKAIGGKPKSDDFFEKFKNYFSPEKDYKIWVARDNGSPVAALLLFYYRDMVEYYTPVIKESYREKQPLSLLIFEAMKNASELGFKMWNWGGTWATQGGVYTFKKRWGTIDKNYNYHIQVNNPAVFNSSKEILLNEYPDFFVVPFSMLTEAKV